MGYIYLASPYTGTEKEQHKRFIAACKCAARLMEQGEVVYSPIVHGHTVAKHMSDKPHDFWMKQCYPMLERASLMCVLQIDGWAQSKGVSMEIEFANKLNIPVVFLAS